MDEYSHFIMYKLVIVECYTIMLHVYTSSMKGPCFRGKGIYIYL